MRIDILYYYTIDMTRCDSIFSNQILSTGRPIMAYSINKVGHVGKVRRGVIYPYLGEARIFKVIDLLTPPLTGVKNISSP